MVVVSGAAAPIGALPIGGAQHIDLTGISQYGECPVDGGQPNVLTGMFQQVMDLLCAAEVVELVEHGSHRESLSGRPSGRQTLLTHLSIPPAQCSS
jgi:hypothetical protein